MHGNVNLFPEREEAHGWDDEPQIITFLATPDQECRRRQLNAAAKLMRLTEIFLQKLFSAGRDGNIESCLLDGRSVI